MKNLSQIDHDVIEYLIILLENSEKWDAGYSDDDSMEGQKEHYQAVCCLKKFVDRMPGGFFVYRADGNEEIIYANEAMVRFFNCDSLEEFREVTGNSFRGIVHPDDLEAVEKSIREQIANSSEELDYVEYRIIPKGGGIRWLDDYGHYIHSKEAGDVYYVFVGDATEKKSRMIEERNSFLKEGLRKEGELKSRLKEYDQKLERNRQEQLRRLEVIEGLSVDYESIFYVDLDINLMKAYRVSHRFEREFPENERVRGFAGFDADYIKDWVYPDDRELLHEVTEPEYIREKLSENKSFYTNYRIYRDGKPAYMQLLIVNVGSEERISQVVFGYRNTDSEVRKEMEQKQLLVNALHEATVANNAKNFFLSNMSHDIRTPMNAIMGFTELARKNLDDREKTLKYLDMITMSSDQLLQLLNDVLEISKIESAQIHMEESEGSLIEIFQQIQRAIFSRAGEKKITLSLDISNLRHDIVLADRQKIHQILSYLVDNALKYTEEGGRITIVISELEEQKDGCISYQFVVEDTGIGISEDFLEHIFEAFEREKNTTFSGIHGTGLGLTITKKLVDMMGGNIYVNSKPGVGSKFIVTLPLRIQKSKSESADRTETSDSLKSAGSSDSPEDEFRKLSDSKKILLVDDNEINLEIEAEMLRSVGFLVDTAADGSIAYEIIRQSSPGEYDLILMDIQMPVMDGYHATRAIREIADPKLAGIPIIAVSANTFEEDKRKSLESGMNAHLPKPLDMGQLLELIRKFL